MAATKDVVDHHLKCLGELNLDGIMIDYSSDAVLFTPGGSMKGREAIKSFFHAALTELAQPGTSFSIQRQCVEGDNAYLLWNAETGDNVYEVATDTFVVRDGKIVAQSFAAKITKKR